MRERERPFSEGEIRSFMSQMLQGLAHMHRNGYFHRDLKPGIRFFMSVHCLRHFRTLNGGYLCSNIFSLFRELAGNKGCS